MSAEVSVYQGKPTLLLKANPSAKWFFSFGLAKAKLIVDNIDEIKAFVTAHESGVKFEGLEELTSRTQQ